MCDEQEGGWRRRLGGPPIVAGEEEDEVDNSEVEKDVRVGEARLPRARGARRWVAYSEGEGEMDVEGWEDGAASETREDHWTLSDSRDDSCCWSSIQDQQTFECRIVGSNSRSLWYACGIIWQSFGHLFFRVSNRRHHHYNAWHIEWQRHLPSLSSWTRRSFCAMSRKKSACLSKGQKFSMRELLGQFEGKITYPWMSEGRAFVILHFHRFFHDWLRHLPV